MREIQVKLLYVNEKEVFGFLAKQGNLTEEEFVPSNVLFCSKEYLPIFLALNNITSRDIASYQDSIKLTGYFKYQFLIVESKEFNDYQITEKFRGKYQDLPFMLIVLLDSQKNVYEQLSTLRYIADSNYQLYSLSELLKYREEHQFPLDKMQSVSERLVESFTNSKIDYEDKLNEQAFLKSLEDSFIDYDDGLADLTPCEVEIERKSVFKQEKKEKGHKDLEKAVAVVQKMNRYMLQLQSKMNGRYEQLSARFTQLEAENQNLLERLDESKNLIQECHNQLKEKRKYRRIEYILLMLILLFSVLGMYPF